MATTFTLISSTTLSASAASVTFSSIPSTYTDLCLKISARDSSASAINDIWIQFESGTSSTLHSMLRLSGNASAASSNTEANSYRVLAYNGNDASTATANTFSNSEIYIPSYTASQNKPLSWSVATENNVSVPVWIHQVAGLWRSTSAINTIYIYPSSGANFVSGSSFYLYGIRSA